MLPASLPRAALVAVLASLAFSGLAGCGADDPSSEESDLTNVEKQGGASQKWLYLGMLPKLEGPTVFVSLTAHTARVSGLLPVGFEGELPFYAVPTQVAGGRTQVTVVYPVATGKTDPSTGKAPAGPGAYSVLYAVPYTPTTEKAAWGGFPFMKYHASRGLAFHGPITSTWNAEMGEYEWRLLRGPVSHGCQRMAGEHVVELAHVLGLDMSKPHSSGETATLKVKVTVSNEFDKVDGKPVDVDYPAQPGVKRPTGDVAMFSTWDSNDFPRWVCAYDKTRPLDAHHCEPAGADRRDPLTGELYEVPDEPWVGTPCDADADCGFSAKGKQAVCLRAASGKAGFCSVACDGYCPDKEGASRTFCATHGSGGRCMAKVGPENDDCGAIPGTKVTLKKRYVGKSGAAAAEASVCSF